MSKDTDENMSKEYRLTLINKNMSFDTCKECPSSFTTNYQLHCREDNPEVHNCNLLKVFYTK